LPYTRIGKIGVATIVFSISGNQRPLNKRRKERSTGEGLTTRKGGASREEQEKTNAKYTCTHAHQITVISSAQMLSVRWLWLWRTNKGIICYVNAKNRGGGKNQCYPEGFPRRSKIPRWGGANYFPLADAMDDMIRRPCGTIRKNLKRPAGFPQHAREKRYEKEERERGGGRTEDTRGNI